MEIRRNISDLIAHGETYPKAMFGVVRKARVKISESKRRLWNDTFHSDPVVTIIQIIHRSISILPDPYIITKI